MSRGRLVPIIVGVCDIKNPSTNPEDALEPKELMCQAIQGAAQDTGLERVAANDLLSEVDSIDVVRTWTWPYDNLAGDIATAINAKPAHKLETRRHGGDQPAKLVDEAARRISFGQSEIAVITGGEALASLGAHMTRTGCPPPGWTDSSKGLESIWADEAERSHKSLGGKYGIGAPVQVYPLYENSFRAYRKQSIPQNNRESAKLYAEFARIAAKDPYSWTFGRSAANEEAIGVVSRKNRMISFPYPLLMNAFNNVNLAAACLLTSTEHARKLSIPESRWIYARGGAGTKDSDDFLRRPNFHTSPSISRSLDAALKVSNITSSDVDAYDFYSCFPIVPKLACTHLGLPMTPPLAKPISLLGSLTSFGGAGNNYSMHAITHMVRYLRNEDAKHGLILANGGVLTYQHVICLSTVPRGMEAPYPGRNPLPETLSFLPDFEIENLAEGEAVIETYTVDFHRDGKPRLAHVVGRLVHNGKRFVANHGNESTLAELTSGLEEQIGKHGDVRVAEGGRNTFSFPLRGKL